MMHLWLGGLCIFYIIVTRNIGCCKQRETRNVIALLMVFFIIGDFLFCRSDILAKNFFVFENVLTSSFDILQGGMEWLLCIIIIYIFRYDTDV